jgi:hypothetical protein
MSLISCALIPYCPLPVNTGGKAEMWRSLQALRELGPCRVLSARTKPVGAGWTTEEIGKFRAAGFDLRLREDYRRRSAVQQMGIAYAALFKALGMEKAFGHSNPYHRHAFPVDWWRECVEGCDVAVIHYSYWARLPCPSRKVVNLLDLWSDYMWEGPRREVEELSTADLVLVISKDEERRLNEWGIKKTVWIPPAVKRSDLPLGADIGCVGSENAFNVEGLRWLEPASGDMTVRVYGGLAAHVSRPSFVRVGRYDDPLTPYRECGIILLPTAAGTGIQIKTIEALACGRAIVARQGAARGLPEGKGAWIEVTSAAEMVDAALALQADEGARVRQAAAARMYYDRFLDADVIGENLCNAYSGP